MLRAERDPGLVMKELTKMERMKTRKTRKVRVRKALGNGVGKEWFSSSWVGEVLVMQNELKS